MSDFYSYGVNWQDESHLPLWQLTAFDTLRVNVTKEFDAKYSICAVTELFDSGNIRTEIEKGNIDCTAVGRGDFIGYTNSIFHYVPHPRDGYGWTVTNSVFMLPDWSRVVKRPIASADVQSLPVKHRNDVYSVQFMNVPWTVFKRYWRKPINLNSQFHGSKYALGFQAVTVLHYDLSLAKQYKCIIADFAPSVPNYATNKKFHDWMVKYARKFLVFSDHESPFVKGDAEFLFTMEWM